MANQFAHLKLIILDSGKRGFPFAVSTCSGRCLGYFKNRRDAQKYCAGDAQGLI